MVAPRIQAEKENARNSSPAGSDSAASEIEVSREMTPDTLYEVIQCQVLGLRLGSDSLLVAVGIS